MRRSVTNGPLTVTAYAGSTGILLAWDLDASQRVGLLGFGIRRKDRKYPNAIELRGGIAFPGQAHPPGEFLDTFEAPIQAFRWGDYTVYPDEEYEYEIVALSGVPGGHLTEGASVKVKVTTEAVNGRTHSVAFNRAVAASQAYTRRFDDSIPMENPAAFEWLSRGLDDLLLDFMGRATDDGWALDVVIYEYVHEEIRAAVRAARGRGAAVRIMYHADTDPTDKETIKNALNIAEDGWSPQVAHARLTSAICHDKMVVLSKVAAGVRTPVAVLTGSTNWTLNGLTYQANIGHIVQDAAVAATYLAAFEQLFAGADMQAMRAWNSANTPIPAAGATPALTPLLSPRKGRDDLTYYASLIGAAKRSLIFATAFALDSVILDALQGLGGPKILRYGLQNTSSRITGYSRDFDSWFTATGHLVSGPPGFRPESTHGQEGNLLIHAKTIVLDFDTSHPVIITGSANFSDSSSARNDENVLVIRDDTRVADIYLAELFRLFDHYRTRYKAKDPSMLSANGTDQRRDTLDPTDAWCVKYYDEPGSLREVERKQLPRPQ